MFPDLLVDAVVGAALHGEDHVHGLRVREGHVLLVLRVPVPCEPRMQQHKNWSGMRNRFNLFLPDPDPTNQNRSGSGLFKSSEYFHLLLVSDKFMFSQKGLIRPDTKY